MKELLIKYYNLFQFESGENTCIIFTTFSLVFVGLIIAEIITRVKKHRSLFF